MFKYKEKLFLAPAIAPVAGAAAKVIGSSVVKDLAIQDGVGLATTALGNKAAAKQGEEQMRDQRRLQNQQIKAQAKQNQQMMNTLKQVAKTNPTVAGAAAGQMMQQQFAISAESIKNVAKVAKGSAKDLAIVGKKMGAHKKLANGLAMGATAAGASYIVDKAIQADAKRSGIDLGETKDERKDNGKKLGKAALAVGGTALAVIGAKKGYLGKSVQGTANKYLTRTNASKVGKTVGNAFKEQFVDSKKLSEAKTVKDKLKSVNGTSLAITAGFAAMPAVGYAMNKKAIKEQAKQSEEQQREYANPATKGLSKSLSGIGKFVRTQAGKVVKYVKGLEPQIKRQAQTGTAKATSNGVASFKEAPVRKVLGGISSFMGGGGQEGTAKFTEELAKQAQKSGNTGTAKAAEFLGKHKTLAVGGSIAVGSMMFKPFGLGEKAVKTATGAVDKNAMRYEKSQNKTVEEE